MTAALFIFPPSRRVDLVQHITDVGENMPTQYRRAKYWQQRKTSLTKQLRKQGFNDAEIAKALDDLFLGIRAERDRRRRMADTAAKTLGKDGRNSGQSSSTDSDQEARS